MTCLPCVEIESNTRRKPDASVIWLHGLGADGNDFAGIVPELKLPPEFSVRFVMPHAPSIPVSINNGYVMPAWYDILEMDVQRRVDEKQLRESAAAVCALIEREVERGIDPARIVLAGFSQGGAVVYEAGLSYPQKLAGILALSTYFATAESIELHEANKQIPLMICHGTLDAVVREELGRRSAEFLKEKAYQVIYRTYPMEHSVCMPQINDISAWLQQLLAPVQAEG